MVNQNEQLERLTPREMKTLLHHLGKSTRDCSDVSDMKNLILRETEDMSDDEVETMINDTVNYIKVKDESREEEKESTR